MTRREIDRELMMVLQEAVAETDIEVMRKLVRNAIAIARSTVDAPATARMRQAGGALLFGMGE